MRIYVAGKFEEIEAVRACQKALKELGHEITYDWTPHCDVAHRAATHVGLLLERGVAAAEVFFLLWHPNLRGVLVELGAAVAWSLDIVVVGCPPPDEQPNVFFHHNAIKHFARLEDALARFA